MLAGRQFTLRATFVFLVLIVESKCRCCPRVTMFGPSLHALFGFREASVARGSDFQCDRPDPDACGFQCAPPALRMPAFRHLTAVLSAPGEVGDPPTMNSDASFGSSFMGCQSPEVAFSAYDADGCVLDPLVGGTPRSHSGSRRELAQRAKVCYFPCCAYATYVALPPPFAVALPPPLDNDDLGT